MTLIEAIEIMEGKPLPRARLPRFGYRHVHNGVALRTYHATDGSVTDQIVVVGWDRNGFPRVHIVHYGSGKRQGSCAGSA